MRLPMNTSLATLKPSGIRRINALAAQHPGCIALALGEPDFPTPDVISAEVIAALDRGDTHYPPNNGRPALREALSAYMGDAGLTFSADEVILTDGATEALSATFMAMLNPGDEVIIPTPAFGLYESIVVANHAKAVFLDTEPAQFQIDEDALRACVTPATKAIVICSPNNPTGCILNTASLDAVARVADRVAVMYAGKIVELGTAEDIFYDPRHPYTWGLIRSIPEQAIEEKKPLTPIHGNPPSLMNLPEGCVFSPRCPYATDKCRKQRPERVVTESGHYSACHYSGDPEFLKNAPETSRTRKDSKKGGEA